MALADQVGVPIKLLLEGEGHVVTIELKGGETYRGLLTHAEETMNCKLSNVLMTSRDGRARRLEHVYLRGAFIKFIVLPDLLKEAPMFKKVVAMKKSADAREATAKAKAKQRGAGGASKAKK